jgi:hypothetical protein
VSGEYIENYPPRGVMYASCGCRVGSSEEIEMLGYRIEEPNYRGGYDEVESWGCYCPMCAVRLKIGGGILTEPAE